MIAGGALSIVLARTIGPSGNGHFALLLTLTSIAGMFVSLGLTAGITYEVSRRRWSVREVFRTSYLAALVLGLIGFLGGLAVFVLTRSSVFEGVGIGLMVVALASLPPLLAYQFADAIMLARERYEGYAALEISHSAMLLLVGAGLAIPFGLTGAVIGLPAAALVGAAVPALCCYPGGPPRHGRRPGPVLGARLRFGLQSWGANLLQQINYRFDILILGGFATARDVGDLLRRADPDEHRLGIAARARDGALPSRGEP